tara:strand:+ start:8019 stop:9323 length:1305 start_codon:yes stop_codon:yes gene_type:complete
MSVEEKTIETKMTQENVNLDEIFNAAPGADTITLPEQEKPNMFSSPGKVDMTFTEETTDVTEAATEEPEGTEAVNELVEEQEGTETPKTETPKATSTEASEVFDAIDEVEGVDTDKSETRGRKKISGITDVFNKLIKDDKIVPFDDDKDLDDYTAKDWEELIQANLDEKANQVRRETPKQFFESLPQELQIAARYVADGGQDLKGLFGALSVVEQTRDLNIKTGKDQEYIIREYLGATGYGNAEEIQEEIEIWKDLGKLEQQAAKFKPKLDKMQEKVVAQKLEEQQMRQAQQQKASQTYMENVYNTLKEGNLGEIRMDKKTQAMLYNGLVQPNYPSINGQNTNLLGHLLEKYQFVEPNYQLISEALWLLQDPTSYKAKVMEKGAQKSVEQTVRKLKTEQSNRAGSSLGVSGGEEESSKVSKRKLPRSNNIFKKF